MFLIPRDIRTMSLSADANKSVATTSSFGPFDIVIIDYHCEPTGITQWSATHGLREWFYIAHEENL